MRCESTASASRLSTASISASKSFRLASVALLSVVAFPLRRPFLAGNKIVLLDQAAACFGVNAAGDNVQMRVVGVVMGDKNGAGFFKPDRL